MANECVKTGYAYYQKQFNEESGRLFAVKRAYQAGSIFDPHILATVNAEEASLLLSQLKYFKFPEFTQALHEKLMKEFGSVKEQAQESLRTDAFSKLPGSNDYDIKLEELNNDKNREASNIEAR